MGRRSFSSIARDSDGTWMIALGALVASLGAYALQVIGGRALGAEGFAPVAALWTIGFLVHTIVMLPVEQMTTRTVTLSGGDVLPTHTRRQIAIALGMGSAAGIAVAALAVDRFFEGNVAFIAVMALLMLGRVVMTLGRGTMAGRRRFAAYGISMMFEAVTLTGLGVLFAVLGAGAAWFGAAIAAAPLTVLLVRPYLVRKHTEGAPAALPESASLLQLLVAASALSQLILAGGPLVVSLVGGTAAEVSVYFITFTLLRGPITASYGLATRFLAAMATALSERKTQVLHDWATRLAAIGTAAAAIAGVGSYFILPILIEMLYGAEFRPTALVAGLGGAGAVAALAILFISQILIARGRTRDIAVSWLAAAVVAGVVLAISDAEPLLRTAYAFFAGELSAFALVSLAAIQGR
jgi:O-antigen/teichoic acid export membrane protein